MDDDAFIELEVLDWVWGVEIEEFDLGMCGWRWLLDTQEEISGRN